jgi:hypothetical protein
LPSSLTAVHPSFGLTNPLSISSCLRTCNAKGFRFSYTTNLAVGNTCQCSSSVAILNSDICGLFRSYVYVNKAVPAPSGARKRLLEQIKRSENLGLCPAGLQSCRVGSDSSDDYEVSPTITSHLLLLMYSASMFKQNSSLAADVLLVYSTVLQSWRRRVSSKFLT